MDSLLQGDVEDASPPSPPLSFSYNGGPSSPVVPLIAARVSLPEQLNIVPMERVLPPAMAASYNAAAAPSLLRPASELQLLNHLHPLRRPRIAGARSEYVELVGRMRAQGMVSFTAHPRAVNGVFAVAKDSLSDRLIIDAQPANRLFIDPPRVQLPNPAHLVQMHCSKDTHMYVAKSDLSNFYHHIGLPQWLQPYFALPPLTPAELASIGESPGAAFPQCCTMPMGFSHAVLIAQSAHEHVVYSSGALQREHSILNLASPTVPRDYPLHGIVIDDLFLFCLSRLRAQQSLSAVLAAYERAGFVVKQSKVVQPTTAPVKIIGFDICGADASVQPHPELQYKLVRDTQALLLSPTVTGLRLASLVGHWTWALLLRRPALCVLQQCYRYIRVADFRQFTLWPSVRRELHMLVSLLPLLRCDLDAAHFRRALASDASELAAGLVSTTLTPEVEQRLWPLCSARHHAVQQTKFNAESQRASASGAPAPTCVDTVTAAAAASYTALYALVRHCSWRTLISSRWRSAEHINALELRAVLLAMHWLLSSPSSLSSRVFLLLDSTVAFFSLWKGRSSSPALLLVLRKISALLLAGGISLQLGWLPSAVNPADGPSRLLGDSNNDGG